MIYTSGVSHDVIAWLIVSTLSTFSHWEIAEEMDMMEEMEDIIDAIIEDMFILDVTPTKTCRRSIEDIVMVSTENHFNIPEFVRNCLDDTSENAQSVIGIEAGDVLDYAKLAKSLSHQRTLQHIRKFMKLPTSNSDKELLLYLYDTAMAYIQIMVPIYIEYGRIRSQLDANTIAMELSMILNTIFVNQPVRNLYDHKLYYMLTDLCLMYMGPVEDSEAEGVAVLFDLNVKNYDQL